MKNIIYTFLLLCTVIPLISMEDIDDTKIKEITDFLYAQEVRTNASRNNFSSHILATPSWVSKEYPQGYTHDIPACLMENNKATFNGPRKTSHPSITNPDFFQKSNNGRYSAIITTTTLPQDTVCFTEHGVVSNKTTTLFNNKCSTNKICFNPTSTHVITGGKGNKNILQTWDLAIGKRQQTLEGHTGFISIIEYNHAGTKLLTISQHSLQSTVILWDASIINNIKPINTVQLINAQLQLTNGRLCEAVFSPADDRVFVFSVRGEVIVLDGNTGTVIATHPAYVSIIDENIITKAIFTPDNQFCFTTAARVNRGITTLWDTCTGHKITTLLDCDTFVLSKMIDNYQGIGLMPDNCSVITTFNNRQAMLTNAVTEKAQASLHHFEHEEKQAIRTNLVSENAHAALHYLKHEAIPQEKVALYHIYCAYKNDTPACQFPPSVVDLLPSKRGVRCFIEKHLFWNKNLVQLDDGSQHILMPNEIEASTVLLQKKLLREKTTPEQVKKWGYTIEDEDYDRLEKAPLYLKNITQKQLNLFRKFLNLNPVKWKSLWKKLSLQEQEDLFFIASKHGLGVSQLMSQLFETIVLPEVIEAYTTPHLHMKEIINYLRYHIISDNARNQCFTQTTSILSQEMEEIQFNNVLSTLMAVPKALIKKTLYCFSGSIGAAGIVLEGKKWTCDITKKINNNLIYYITPTITNEEARQSPLSAFPTNEHILWATDSSKNVLYKKVIHYDGKWSGIKFSPDGNYIVIRAKATDTHPNPTLALINLGHQADGSGYTAMLLPIDKEINTLCFNDQSTVLATGTTSAETTNNVITLWDTSTGKPLSSIPVSLGVVKNLCFNHSGTRLFAAYGLGGSSISQVTLFDVTHCNQPINIAVHTIINDIAWAHPYFSDDDTKMIVTLTEGNLLFLDGITGIIINNKEKEQKSRIYRRVASVFNNDKRLLVSAAIAEPDYEECGNTLLWDTQTGIPLATVIQSQPGVHGVGFTPDKRHIVTMGENDIANFIITTTLFDEDTHKALKWLKHGTSFLQKYALYCAYKAQLEKNSKNKSVPYLLQHVLSSLPKEAYNAKEIMEKFLQ